MPSKLLYAVLVALLFVSTTVLAESIVFPPNSGIVDISKPPYNADRTGATDVTAILQAAIDSTNAWRVVYLPNGTYKVSSTVHYLLDVSPTRTSRGPILQGQSRKGTVIRLAPGSFTNTSAPQPVLWTGSGVAQNFQRGLHSMTVLVAPNNPGATGVRWYSNNQGTMSDIDIISEDGRGIIGLDLQEGEQGPCLVRDVYVKGFDYGIRGDALDAITLTRITVEAQNIEGIHNGISFGNPMWLDSVRSINTVRAVYNQGHMTLVDAYFTGGSSSIPAIYNTGNLFARGVATEGYQKAIQSTLGTAPSGSTISEFSARGCLSKFAGSEQRSLNLPVKRPPVVAWQPDLTKWANVEISKGTGFQPRKTDVRAVQAALDSVGMTALVAPFGKTYAATTSADTALVRGSVWHIVGGSGNIQGIPLIIVDSPGAPPVVKIEKMNWVTVYNRSSRTVIIEECTGTIVAEGSGDMFVSDFMGRMYVRNHNQRVWAWQYNCEYQEGALSVEDGVVRMFGFKNETGLPAVSPVKPTDGVLEILGLFEYALSGDKGTTPMMVFTNTAFSMAGQNQTNFGGGAFATLLTETRGNQTETLMSSQSPTWGNLVLYSGWTQQMLTPYSDVINRADPLQSAMSRRDIRTSTGGVRTVDVTRTHALVQLTVAKDAPVSLALYRMDGRCVAQESWASLGRGAHSVRLPTSEIRSGMYCLSVTADGSSTSHTITIVR